MADADSAAGMKVASCPRLYLQDLIIRFVGEICHVVRGHEGSVCLEQPWARGLEKLLCPPAQVLYLDRLSVVELEGCFAHVYRNPGGIGGCFAVGRGQDWEKHHVEMMIPSAPVQSVQGQSSEAQPTFWGIPHAAARVYFGLATLIVPWGYCMRKIYLLTSSLQA